MFNIAVCGFGSRLGGVIERLKETGEITLCAIADPRTEEIKKDLESKGYEVDKIKFYLDLDQLLSDMRPDGICIGTRCDLHTSLAEKVIPLGIPLFLEKPVATTREDLDRLKALTVKYPENCKKVTVSFPLRLTEHVRMVKEIIDRGDIGEIAQVQAWNNVYYAIGYYHKWYRDAGITGGQFLQKATHDFDYINYIVGHKPKTVAAMRSSVVFGGKKPAGLFCRDCAEKDTCPDYTDNQNRPTSPFDYCAYGKDITIEDSDSAIVMYDNGVHCVYTQNFIARKKAGARGARFIGQYGTVEFDWQKNKILLFKHYEDRNEEIEVPAMLHHGGGDAMLAQDFLGVLKGEESCCGLEDGIASADLCLAARESSEKNIFVNL